MNAISELERLSGSLYIDARYVRSESATRFEVIDPATERPVGWIADATDAEIDDALEAAISARKRWAALDPRSRAVVLHDIAAEIRNKKALYGAPLTLEEGKPYKESVDEVSWCATAIDYYAEMARHEAGRLAGTTVPGQFHFSVKEPLGTVVIILPFNFPLVLLCWEAAAALAAGNAVIVKPHEQTSLTTLKFAELFSTLPSGLFQVVTGGARVGQRLVASPKTHGVAYTGSVSVGQQVARTCAETFKPCLIEASGNDPFIVMPSAPLEIAARGAAFAAYLNCGQVCTAAERFYVHEAIYDKFAEQLAVETKKLRVGNGFDQVDIGPMATRKQRDRFEAMIAHARQQGARVKTGGGRPAHMNQGWFVEPTVLTDVAPEFEILNEESFGPVAPLCSVSSFDEAMTLANQSRFGLGANLYSLDMDEIMRAVREFESGIVWINAPLLDNDALPFGGRKLSGTGRQLGPEGLAQFQNTKFVMIDPKASKQDFWWFPYSNEESFRS
ncbi:aldehyde dehydrogenase [Mesorhizobium sp. M3A.F.Ca.ET.080.04.2.1]|uniref:aldehyde dehydrogenase family protein n=1 Tax=Mesorhizobium sp. M3A.F.Ca.ET.080.04.2.1 TaxID=2493676 RepID=UPI000F765CFE|nr:aldehyde dehydrogenase family protein [Mesorhizobium sp. M3A.F.Ca.ET.080.04.2.1]AZO07964.1 aldehyde dehydrogenase [Mesorhizobium sp. M3A.F.Ca.ET.080.04.2.1]